MRTMTWGAFTMHRLAAGLTALSLAGAVHAGLLEDDEARRAILDLRQRLENSNNSMKIVKNIFARIWCAWGLISFIGTFLLIFLPSMLSYAMEEMKGQKYFLAISRLWMNLWLFLIACPVRVTGKENFEKGKNYIVVFNHNALLDVPLSAPYVPGPNKTIAKASSNEQSE